MTGHLYVVATPLGNLGDMTPRAIEVLNRVAVIAAEDTRHSGQLCQQFGIRTPLLSLHNYNEQARVDALLTRLHKGEDVALVSDAGTPLISDPGYRLVRAARHAQIPVLAIAGPCALVAALSVAGLPTDRFTFEGFPPASASARRACFTALVSEPRTLVFYESPHRLADCLADLASVFGADREAAVLRELTKRFEEGRLADLATLRDWAAGGVRGECVIVVAGASPVANDSDHERILTLLLAQLPLRQAVDLACEITGAPRRHLYARALILKN
ncbi:MAG: 16S rRNA (cytidine(1402)-2'-O)-methyltransferase [Acidiferrobacter sp.]